MDDITKARQSKAQRILEAARNRPPEERAGYALRKLTHPTFGPRLRRYDLGNNCPTDVRADNIARGAEKLLRLDGVFMDGLVVKAHIAEGNRVLLTCIPKPADAPPTPEPLAAGDFEPLPPRATPEQLAKAIAEDMASPLARPEPPPLTSVPGPGRDIET